MLFKHPLKINREIFFRHLKMKESAANEQIIRQAGFSMSRIETAATPRLTYRQFDISFSGDKITAGKNFSGYDSIQSETEACVYLTGTTVCFRGKNIHTHLQDCSACILLAVTLGSQAEQMIRAAEAVDMSEALMLDIAASVLVDQYVDEAEMILRRNCDIKGSVLTKRFSPGYGDFPIEIQSDFLQLLQAEKMIGLTVSQSNILLPRKSVTAVIGVV